MTDRPTWVNDTGISWRILLTARLQESPDPARLQDRLDEVAREHGWARSDLRRSGDLEGLRTDLAAAAVEPVVVGVAGRAVVVSAHHAHVDGLGLLTLLGRLTDQEVTSTARGVADREERPGGFAAAATRRLGEAALAPPASVALPPRPGALGDVLVERDLLGTTTTSDLVAAAAAAVVATNQRAGRRTRHLSVAVGAGRPAAPDEGPAIRNRSALMRLRDLEGVDATEVRERLRSAPLEPPPRGGGAGGRLTSAAMRLLANRLGSTLLVSHLGSVTAPGVDHLAFHPVTAGRTGLSLGAVALAGTTTVSLRTRAANATPDGLAGLLETVASGLGGEPA